MKKNVIYKLISFYVLVVIIGFFGGYFITDLINKQNEIYVSSFTLKEDPSLGFNTRFFRNK